VRRHGRRPRPLGEILELTRADAEPATLLAAVQGAWRRAVGERIAAEATPVREREGTITVACRAATWAQELDLLQSELRANLNAELERGEIAGFRLVVASEEDFDTN